MPRRQKQITEMPNEQTCRMCNFYTEGCTVPGGTCVFRQIMGIPGHYVGDILANAGVIEPGWEIPFPMGRLGLEDGRGCVTDTEGGQDASKNHHQT